MRFIVHLWNLITKKSHFLRRVNNIDEFFKTMGRGMEIDALAHRAASEAAKAKREENKKNQKAKKAAKADEFGDGYSDLVAEICK